MCEKNPESASAANPILLAKRTTRPYEIIPKFGGKDVDPEITQACEDRRVEVCGEAIFRVSRILAVGGQAACVALSQAASFNHCVFFRTT